MREFGSFVRDKGFGILFPKTCPVCGEIIARKAEICAGCNENLTFIREPKCKKCGKPFDTAEMTSMVREYCDDCIKHTHMYDCGMAVFQYNEDIREAIYRFKYHNQRTYAGFFGKVMARQYGRDIARLGVQAIIPVPISRKKKIDRGYNQAELIANVLGQALKLPVERKIIIRSRHTTPQKELNFTERKKNLKNAFKISESIVKYKVVLLVDDIYTTGSTIDACAGVLKAAGVKKVYFISLAIGEGI